jgi:tetratricopeptide (TPR) repeat protein
MLMKKNKKQKVTLIFIGSFLLISFILLLVVFKSPTVRARLYCQKGLALIAKDDKEGAIKEYDKAIEVDSKYSYAYALRGQMLSKKGNYNEAIKDYTKAIKINPEYPPFYTSRGSAFMKQDKLEEAIKDFDKAIDLNKESPDAYHAKGHLLFKEGDLDGAIKDFRKALALNRSLEDKKRINQVIKAIEIIKKHNEKNAPDSATAAQEI